MITASRMTRIAVKNILFPTDFSLQSDAAFAYAALLARHYGATVHAVHVFTPDLYGALPAETLATSVVRMRQDAQAHMDQLHRRLAGLAHETYVAEGRLWSVLEQVVRDQGIDIIVLGTAARKGMERVLLGSEAELIFRRAEVPVLTVGPRARAAEEDVRFTRILFATDFSAAAEAAAAQAIALAQEYQSHLTLLHVIEDAKGEFKADYLRVAAYLTEKLRGLVPPEAELWCEPEIRIQCGKPAECILATATDRKSDLIVLGARRSEHELAATHLSWPTAAHVVHEAACPVLTVRG
jgi:nucleotide-binding universal stress UspA family protein